MLNILLFCRLLIARFWIVSIFYLCTCCHHAYRRLYIDLNYLLQKISFTIKESLVEHETKCRRHREMKHAIFFKFRFIFWARITIIKMTKFSRVLIYNSFDHRSRLFNALTTRILLLDDQWHSSFLLRTQVLWSKSFRNVFIFFRECYTNSIKRLHTNVYQMFFFR